MECSVINLLRKRRSIRKYQPQPIESEKIEALVEAAVRAPTSRGRNPWEFIVVTAPALIKQLANAKEHGSAFLAGAPLVIVVAADTAKSDVWTEDCSIAAFAMQLTAADLGLGSCWVQIRLRPHDATTSAEDFIKQALGVPATYTIECMLGVGYPAEDKPGHVADNLPYRQVHRDTFQG